MADPAEDSRKKVVLVCLALLLAACEEPRPGSSAVSPLLRAAIVQLDRVRTETLDKPFDHPDYDSVLAAFEAVPEGTPDRMQAESWILWLQAKRSAARERRRRLAAEVMAPADSYQAFLEQRAAAAKSSGEGASADEAAAANDAAAGSADGARAHAGEEEVDKLGRSREFWFHRGQEFSIRLADLELEVADQREYTERVCFRYEMEACAHAKVLLAELEQKRDKAAIVVQRLKDDARQNGVPPGWLRHAGSDEPRLGEPIPRPPDEVDNHGRGKRHWQDRKRGLLDHIEQLESEVAQAQEEAREKCADPGSPQAVSDVPHDDPVLIRARNVDLSEVSHKPGKIDSTVGVQLECTRATERHAKLKAALQKTRDELASLEDEARRAGALPGWIR